MGIAGTGTFSLEFVQSIEDVPQEDWNQCAGASNPFVDHRFLAALETSGSVGEGTGWSPYHVVVRANDGENSDSAPMLCIPLYLKAHSYGEYVFDHGWADAYERAGGQYYPKLQGSIPFTPAVTPKLLVRPNLSTDMKYAVQDAAIAGMKEITQKNGLSSLHMTFLSNSDAEAFERNDFLIRHDQQFHWLNDGYESFDHFLSTLSSRKRKQIRKERRTANAVGLEFELLTGDAISTLHWDAFFEFYIDTGSRKWGQPYLTKDFFHTIGPTLADRVLLIMVKRNGRYIAGALNFIGQETLYGRQWGCIEDHSCLHFEVCYYRAIEFAIEHKLKTVEAGAQGQHKLARGYAPVTTQSAHFIPNPSFRNAVHDFLKVERQHVAQDQEHLARHLPFRKPD